MLCSDKIYRAPPCSGKAVLGRTLPSLLDEACIRYPNQSAFNYKTKIGWQSLSNQSFLKIIEEVALGLLDLNLTKGTSVALLMHSDVNFAIADMGTLLANLVNVPIDLTQTIENVVFILQHSQAKALILSNWSLFNQIAPYLEQAPDLRTVIVADVQFGETKIQLSPQVQVFSLDQIRIQGRTLISEENCLQLRAMLKASDLATIVYIPGAMAEPQGVMLTHQNLSGNTLAAFSSIPNLKLGKQEVVLSFLPLTHVFARVMLYGHINYGHSIYFTTQRLVMKHFQEVQPTLFATVPLFLEKIYSKIQEQGEIKQRDILPYQSSRISISWWFNLANRYELGTKPRGRYALMLKLADRFVFSKWRAVFGGRLKYLICGGAALKAEIANLFAAARITILQGYGLTETSSAVTCTRGEFNRAGTVGIALPGVEIKLADDGEILTKSPYITQGYYNNTIATQKLIDTQGWLHTGDLGEVTPDGFLKITGLKKSRFKLSTGKYVTPEPLEQKLEQSPLVEKAITVGAERKFCTMLIFPNLANLRWENLSLGIDLSAEELLKHPCTIARYQSLVNEANCHLPYWSTVKRFRLINETLTLEKGMLTSTGEVNRVKVVEVFAQAINAMYEDKGLEDTNKKSQGTSCPYISTNACPVYAQSLNS